MLVFLWDELRKKMLHATSVYGKLSSAYPNVYLEPLLKIESMPDFKIFTVNIYLYLSSKISFRSKVLYVSLTQFFKYVLLEFH